MPIIDYRAPIKLLAAVRGHPFDRNAFDAMFLGMDGITATMVDQPAAAQLMNPAGMAVDCGMFAGSAADFVAFAQGLLATFKQSQHLIGQVHIQVEGNVAHGEVYFLAQHRISEAGVDKDLFVAGRYIDRYENRGEGWKIAKRRELIDWARTDPASNAFMKEQTSLVLGARGAADFSNVRTWP